MVLEGAAKAQLATGAPLMLAFSHFVRWPRVEAALAIVATQRGDTPDADDSRSGQIVVAGMHGGVSQSLPDQAALLNKGVVLCFDCFGRVEWSAGSDYYPSDEESAVRIAELVRQGFVERIVISSGVSRRIHLSRLVAWSMVYGSIFGREKTACVQVVFSRQEAACRTDLSVAISWNIEGGASLQKKNFHFQLKGNGVVLDFVVLKKISSGCWWRLKP